MQTRMSTDQEKYISQVMTYSPNPRSPILVFYKDGRTEKIPNNKIKNFIEFAESSQLIDEKLANDVKSDYPHIFLPQPSREHLEMLYQQMQILVIQELMNAEKEGKKLIIFAAEEHDNNGSLLLQTMLLYILKEAKINNLLIEASPILLSKLIYHPRIAKGLNAEHSIPLANHELEMNVIGADLDLSEDASNKQREAFMVSKCLETNDNCCFIMGATHLKNLMSDERLKDKYHVIGLDIMCITEKQTKFQISKAKSLEERASLAFLSSSMEVKQVNLVGNVSSLEPEEVLASASSIHYKKLEIQPPPKQSSAFFTPSPITSNAVPLELQEALKDGDVEEYIKKGHANLEQLIELQNTKPWVIYALRCYNIRQGIYNHNINIDQLSKLSQDQVSSIQHKFNGTELGKEVEYLANLNLKI